MSPTVRRPTPLVRFALLGFAFGIALLSCGRDVTSPGAGARVARGLSWRADFPPAYQLAGSGAADVVDFDRVHIVLHHSDGTVALDTVINFPAGADSVPVTLDVTLLASAPASGEALSLNLAYIDAAGDTVFKGGPVSVTATPSSPGSPAPPAVSIPVSYTGPGASAVGVQISPRTGSALSGTTFNFTAVAVDQNGAAVPNTPIVWNTLDPGIATIPSAASGTVLAGSTRGTARIVAQLLTGPTDQVTLNVLPLPTTIALSAGSGQSALAGSTLPNPLVALVTASDGLGVSGVTVTFAVASGGGSVTNITAVTNTAGLAQTTWKLGSTTGTQTVTASAGTLIGSPVTFTATAKSAVATALAVKAGPSTVAAGATIASVTIVALTASGDTATSFTGPVTLTLAGGASGATLGGTATVNAAGGFATFTGLQINKTGTGYSLVAASSGLTSVTTNNFDVTAATASKLEFTAQPASNAIGLSIGTVTVVAVDQFGNTVTGFTGAVTLAIGTNPGSSALTGTSSTNAVAGVATFSALTLNHLGTGYTLTASATGLTAATSAPFNVLAGGAASLVAVGGFNQSGNISAALAQPVVVEVQDLAGNAVSGTTVTFAVTTGGGSLSITSGVSDGSGNVSTIWTLGATVGAQSITATSVGLSGSPLTINGTGTVTLPHFIVTTAPAAIDTAGVNVLNGFVVSARDPSNNPIPGFTGTVTLAIGANPGAATLTGTVSVNAVGGTATFNAFKLDKDGIGYTVVASSAGYTSITSSGFNVVSGAATTIAIATGNNQTGAASAVLASPLNVLVTDAGGNPVAGTTVHFAIATGGGSVSAANVNSNAAGVAGTNWTLGAPAGIQTVTATAAGLTGSPLTFTAAAAGGVASTTVTPHLDTLTAIGATFTPAAQAKDGTGTNVAGTFTWLSRTPAVATVNAAGLVTGVTNGSSWVVATETGGTKDSVLMVVQQKLATINVTPGTRNIYLGASYTFAASAVDGLGVALAAQPAFTWTTVSSAIASITAGGIATGVGLGSTQVHATAGAVVGVATLNVLTPISHIILSRDSSGFSKTTSDTFTIAALGRSRSYVATAYDTLNNAMTGITFTFASSNAAVAAIDSTGTVTVRATAAANGSTSISASAQGITGAALLKVQQVLTAIDLSPTTATIAVTGSTALLARGKDANGFFISGGAFHFTSSSPSNATVGLSTGVVTGVANGSATVTAKDSATGLITSNNAIITIGGAVPAIISFGRDTLTVGRSSSASVPIYLSKPYASALTINLAVKDTFAYFSPASISIAAGSTSGNATLNGHNAGTTLVYATDGSGAGYTPDTAVLAVQATMKLTTTNYSLVVNDQVSTQVLLSDPSPAGGTFVTFGYGTPGRATVSPNPAFIPAGQLAANVVILATGAGGTTVTPAATGVNGTPSTITTSAANLTVYPSSLMLGAGQYEINQNVQSPQYLYNPVSVTLTSADTNTVTVPSPIVMTAGTYYAYFNTTGKIPGLVNVTASATGWASSNMSVRVTTPRVGISGGTTLNTTSPAQGFTVYSEDSTGTSHYRTSSLVVQLTSSDTTVIKVSSGSATLTIPASQYYVNSGTVTPVGGGSAWLKVTASGHTPDSTLFTVIGPKLSFSWYSSIIGVGQQDNNVNVQGPNNVVSPLLVTISNPDSTIVGLPPTVTIPTGYYYTYFNVRGKALGQEMFIASAAGYQPDTAFYTVTTPHLVLGAGGTLQNFGPAQGFTTYSADSLRDGHYVTAPVIVTYTSTNTAVFTVSNAIDTIQAGASYTNHVTVTPTGAGTAKLVANAPGYVADTATYIVQTPKLSLSFGHIYLGKRQYDVNGANVQTPNYLTAPLAVTITQRHPSIDSLSATAITIPASSYYQYFSYAGLATGTDTLIASAPGYLPDTAYITVTSTKFVTSGLPGTALTTSPPSTVTVYATDSLGSSHLSLDTIAINAFSSNVAVIQPTAATIHIPKAAYYVQPVVDYTGPGSASMTYSDSAGVYLPVTTNTVTVTGPSLSISNGTPMLGMRQNGGATSANVQVANNVTGSPLVITLVSTDPTVVTVPATVTIPVGTYYAYFQITAHDVIGTIQIQATATGYGGANTSVQVTAPQFQISTNGTLNTTSAPQSITVYAEDANGTQHPTNEDVAVTLASSSTAVGTIDSATVVIANGTYYNNHAKFTPLSAGTTQLSATDGRAVAYRYSTGTVNVAVNTPTLYASWTPSMPLGVGQYSDQNVQTADYQASALTVSFAHFSAASSTPSSVIVPMAGYISTVRISGISVGTDTITASATGENSVKGAVVVGLGRVDQNGNWPSTLGLSTSDSVLVTLYARDPASNVRNVTAATVFTLTGSANVSFTSGGATITSVTIPANAQQVQFYVKGTSAGTSSVSISNANYTTYSPSITVTP